MDNLKLTNKRNNKMPKWFWVEEGGSLLLLHCSYNYFSPRIMLDDQVKHDKINQVQEK